MAFYVKAIEHHHLVPSLDEVRHEAVVAVAATSVAVWLWLSSKDPNRYADVIAGVGPTPGGGMAFALAGRF